MNTKVKRRSFEEGNYPDDTPWYLTLGKISVVGVAIIAGVYVGHHYWFGCTDWLIKACTIVAK